MKTFDQQAPANNEENKKVEQIIAISGDKKSASVSFKNLELNVGNTRSPAIRVVVEKQPIELVEGRSYCNVPILVDRETDLMRILANKARDLLLIPEKERIGRVLEILRSHLKYAYKDVIEELYKADSRKADWVEKNTGITSKIPNFPLSQVLEGGFGICTHFATAYLWLAQKAGLKGVILSSGDNVIKNIRRSDNNERLFKSFEVGEYTSPHVWVEIKTSTGDWIPVDPTTNLIGDTEEGLQMFREANYLSKDYEGILQLDPEPREKLSVMQTQTMVFYPTEAKSILTAELTLRSSRTRLKFGGPITTPTNDPFFGDGKLNIQVNDDLGGFVLDILEVSPTERILKVT